MFSETCEECGGRKVIKGTKPITYHYTYNTLINLKVIY